MTLRRSVVLVLAPRIGGIQSYTLGPEAGYPNKIFMVFLRTSRKLQGQSLEIGHGLIFPNTFLYTIPYTHLIRR